MKILYVFPYNPVSPTFGGALRIYNILRHLIEHHDVTVAGFSTREQELQLVEKFPSLAGKTVFVPPDRSALEHRLSMVASLFSKHSHWYHYSRSELLQQKIDTLLTKQTFDIIQCEFPVMAMYRFRSGAKRVLDCHNVEYDNFLRMSNTSNLMKKVFYRYESMKFRREEIAVCHEQDALFVTSERDISLLNESLPKVPKFLVPNGVDREYFAPFTSTPVPHSMVFVGMMKYLPNHDGVTFFLDHIFPKVLEKYPDATVTIVGKNPPKCIVNRANKQIVVTGFVDDTRPFVEQASVYVVPLRMGGGTRLKILEALSMKKPIVTTAIGAEGIDVKDRKNVLMADDPTRFAESICELFEDQSLTKRLTANGSLLADTYRWEAIAETIEAAYKQLINRDELLEYEQDIERWNYESNGIYTN